MNVSEFLNKSAVLIEKGGWIQHEFRWQNSYCAVGAMMAINEELYLDKAWTEHGPMVEEGIYNQSLKALEKCIDAYEITTWNDQPDQTAKNVIATMRACANANS